MVNLNQAYCDGMDKTNFAFDRSEGVRGSANFDNYKVIPLNRSDIARHSKHYHLADRGDYVIESRNLPIDRAYVVDRDDAALRYSQRFKEPVSYVIERRDLVSRQPMQQQYQVDDGVDYVIERSEPNRYSHRYQVEQIPIERRVNFDTTEVHHVEPEFDQRHYINNNQLIEFNDNAANNFANVDLMDSNVVVNNGPNMMKISEQYQYNTSNDAGFYVNEFGDNFNNAYTYEVQEQYFMSTNGPSAGQTSHMKYDSDV
jgi:hypothetical protein